MRKCMVALIVAALAFASAVATDDLAIRDDPYLQRVVEEAVEMGEHSILNLAMHKSSASVVDLDTPRELESSLLAISSEILGAPATAAASKATRRAPSAAPAGAVGVSFVSVDEHAAFENLLAKSEEERLIEQKKAEIMADQEHDKMLMAEFNDLSSTVDKFQKQLQHEEHMSFADASITAKEQAEVDATEREQNLVDAEIEADFEADVEAELDADADEEAEADEAAEESVDVEEEYDLSSFLELSSNVQAGAAAELKALLDTLHTPSAEEEALEPTLTEEAEAMAMGNSLPSASFLLTEEELTAQLDAVGKEFSA